VDPAKQAANRQAVQTAYDAEMRLHDPNTQPDTTSAGSSGPDDFDALKTTLQKLVDSGTASDEDINAVVQDYKQRHANPMTALRNATSIGAEPPVLTRALTRTENAIGPAIRGAGDVTGANWLLERTGLVPEGRLTGPEANEQDAHTRFTTGLGGTASVVTGPLANIGSAMKESGLIPAAYEAVRHLVPAATYEATKYGLQKIGVPGADLAAFLIAGGTTGRPELRRGGVKRIGEPDMPMPRTDAVATRTGTPAGPPDPNVTWGGAPVESPFRPITPPPGGPTGTGTPAGPPEPTVTWGGQPVESPFRPITPPTAPVVPPHTPTPFTVEGPVPGGPPTGGSSIGPAGPVITVEGEPPPAAKPTPATEEQTVRGQRGGERLGRATGRTTQEVRDAVGPSNLGEAPGAPKPKAPTSIVQLFTDKLRGMPVEGPERQAYVDAGKDALTRGRVDATRETLEHLRARYGVELPKILEQLGPNPSAQDILNLLKLGIPAAVGTRLALLNGMRPVASHDQQPSQ
jgi:hypothetical protein